MEFVIRAAFCLIVISASVKCSSFTFFKVVDCGVPRKIKDRSIDEVSQIQHGDFPWIVTLMNAETSPPKFFCGGTLISTTFVITAAHCFRTNKMKKSISPRDVLALFGAHDLNNCSEPERIVRSPEQIIVHKDWNPQAAEYDADLALLEFTEGKILISDKFIQPICLWRSEDDPPVIEGIVTGWAKEESKSRKGKQSSKLNPNEPRMMTVEIKTNSECDEEKQLLDLKSSRVFCVASQNSSDICHGDTGGGLFVNVGEAYFLKGVRSPLLMEDDDCFVQTNEIYTNVLKFTEWIDETTRVFVKVSCNFETKHSHRHRFEIKDCRVNSTIDNEAFAIGSDVDFDTQSFSMTDNKKIEFIPKNIGRTFPNLKFFVTTDCGVKILRQFYFEGMKQVRWMDLSSNSIATVEIGAFKDLISVEWLELDGNKITTLDAQAFATMVSLEKLYLFDNQIKTLSPTTFEIPGGRLQVVGLRWNVCINDNFGLNDLDRLKPLLEKNCCPKSSDSESFFD